MAPLPLLGSGGLLVPTPLPCVSPRVLLGYRRLLLSPQQARSPPIGCSLLTPLHGIHLLIWIYANVAMVAYQRTPTPQTALLWLFSLLVCLNFPRFFFFCLFFNCCPLCSVGGELWEPAMNDQIYFVTGIYFKEEWDSWLLINRLMERYEKEGSVWKEAIKVL